MDATTQDQRVPLTILTGYLGAGKTTLLKHILEKTKKKIAILMNEFGEIAIDSKIIEGKNVNMAELVGGCVCCSLTGELQLAIKEVIEKAKPEWILLETTGVAEPTAIAIDMKDLQEVRLDAVVCIVDCDAVVRYPQIGHTGREQIEMADILIINKIDLVEPDKFVEVEEKLRDINDRAVFVKALHSKVPPMFLFGLNKEHKDLVRNKKHEIENEVFAYESDATFSKDKFIDFINKLPKEIYRSKGFIKFADSTYIFNFVAGRSDLELFKPEKTELVFIGKDILRLEKEIREKLENCK